MNAKQIVIIFWLKNVLTEQKVFKYPGKINVILASKFAQLKVIIYNSVKAKTTWYVEFNGKSKNSLITVKLFFKVFNISFEHTINDNLSLSKLQ